MCSVKISNNFYENLKKIYEESGLIYAGENEDYEPEWIGTEKEWQNYENLINKFITL